MNPYLLCLGLVVIVAFVMSYQKWLNYTVMEQVRASERHQAEWLRENNRQLIEILTRIADRLDHVDIVCVQDEEDDSDWDGDDPADFWMPKEND